MSLAVVICRLSDRGGDKNLKKRWIEGIKNLGPLQE